MLVTLLVACGSSQQVDRSYRPTVAAPAYHLPVVCMDEHHNNAHTAGGLYAPFAALLRADGVRVTAGPRKLTTGALARCTVLVIVNPSGGKTTTLFGLNLPTESRKRRHLSAFSPQEIEAARAWVEGGGAVLLIADHYPYGASAAAFAARFGVDMSGGFAHAANADPSVPRNDGSRLEFTTQNRLLGDHPIITGRNPGERVNRVVTFTGQSLDAVGTKLLLLGADAIDYMPPPPVFTPRPSVGRAQAIALELGRGRVVVLGEAGMLSAQRAGDHRFGMQLPGNDNQQFALNIVHWLTRAL